MYGLAAEKQLRDAEMFKNKAKLAARARRGRKGSMPKVDLFKLNCIRWRRIIRSVHHQEKSRNEIIVDAIELAAKWTPGDRSVPRWVRGIYQKMSK